MPSAASPRRVVIVDDSRTVQAILDHAFSKRPDFQVVGFANDATSAVEMVRRLVPDVVTIDLCMPYIDGAALLEMIADMPTVCKIVVSDKFTTNLFMTSKLMEAGASACLAKNDLVQDSAAFFRKINAAADRIGAGRRQPLGTLAPLPAAARHPARRTADTPIRFPVPADESERLAFLARAGLASARPERQFDLVTRHVAKVTAFPACLLTVIDRDTQWLKSSYGLPLETTPREQAFCNYTISQGGVFVVSNAATDPRFADNPLVTMPNGIKSYAGHPVLNAQGVAIASLCVIDTRVRTVSRHVIDQLAGMSEIVGEMIAQRVPLAA